MVRKLITPALVILFLPLASHAQTSEERIQQFSEQMALDADFEFQLPANH
jgi:hypothetical protein